MKRIESRFVKFDIIQYFQKRLEPEVKRTFPAIMWGWTYSTLPIKLDNKFITP